MGKAAKEHRQKVLKRNRKIQHEKNKISKEWNLAFEEQMQKMKEQFASASGMTETEGEVTVENTNEVETTNEERQESTESVSVN